MFTSDTTNALLEKVLESLEQCNINENSNGQDSPIGLTPSKILILIGILGGVLSVNSVLIDKRQVIEIVLVGSLKRKTEMDKCLDRIGSKSFEEVMKGIVGHFV
ncbi:hypothetical protein [Desulfotruncus alcoholivorax]|uniref:hypothetical protein n=1 Tax=Desulfotruncus alcoholivorax TaxID=265477 RepID=UPI000427E720|nr:hypothetical protein [Desulfotruncus alcoholivorax]